MSITIYHNPDCGTSRNTLALIRNSAAEPNIVRYLETPPSLAELKQLIADMGISVLALIRTKERIWGELGLSGESSDEALLNAMITHPVLINRPIVVTPLGTRLCRPPERVLEILP